MYCEVVDIVLKIFGASGIVGALSVSTKSFKRGSVAAAARARVHAFSASVRPSIFHLLPRFPDSQDLRLSVVFDDQSRHFCLFRRTFSLSIGRYPGPSRSPFAAGLWEKITSAPRQVLDTVGPLFAVHAPITISVVSCDRRFRLERRDSSAALESRSWNPKTGRCSGERPWPAECDSV